MSQDAEVQKTPDEILSTVFDLVPTLESVYNLHGEQTLEEMFDEILDYKTDEKVFPGFEVFKKSLTQSAAKIYGDEVAADINRQISRSSVLHTQVHLSMMRSFDAAKRLDADGKAEADAHYNTLILQSEILWLTMTRNRGLHALAANSGMITLSNETSPAFIQYGPKASEALRLCNNENFHNGLAYTYTLSQEQILKARKEIAGISNREQKLAALKKLEKLAKAETFAEGVCQVYAQQLQDLFEAKLPMPCNVEATEVLNNVMIENLADENSLTHYIFVNPEVCKYYHDCFAGIAMGWREKEALDENGQPNGIAAYDAFWELKDIKNNGKPSKKMIPHYQALMFDKQSGEIKSMPPAEIIAQIKQQKLAPKYLTHVVFSFLESGILTIGGLAQAPYNTAVKKRCGEFIDGLCNAVTSGKFPPLPQKLSVKNLQQRKAQVLAMPTEIPVAGFAALMADENGKPANYAQFLEGKLHLTDALLSKISTTKVKHAIKAAAPIIFEYKLGAKDYKKLVGDKVITFPQTKLSQSSKQGVASELRGKIATLAPAHNTQSHKDLYLCLKMEKAHSL